MTQVPRPAYHGVVTAVLNLLLFLVLGVICIWMPGFLLARRFLRPRGAVEAVAWPLGLGAIFMSFTGYTLGMLTGWFVGPWTFVAVALGVAVLLHRDLLAALRAVKAAWGAPGGRPALPRPRDAFGWVFLVTTLLAVLVFLGAYSPEDLHLTCVNYKVVRALGVDMGDFPWVSNQLLSLPWGNRGGSPMLITLFPALFQYLGFHVSYAFTFTLIYLFSYLAARRVVGSRGVALAAAAALCLLPWILNVAEIDQNLIGLSLAAMCAALALREERSEWILGALFGLLVCVEHVLILAAPAFLVLGRPRRQLPRALLLFIGGMLVPLAVEGLYHYAAFGNVFHFEHETDDIWIRHRGEILPTFRHAFLFLEFEVDTLLNYPFHDQLVRSPYNGYPTFLLFPLHLLRGYGVLLAAVTLVGYGSLWRRRPRAAAFLTLTCLPYLLILQFQENWSDILKLRLSILFLMTPTVAFAEGLRRCVRRESLPWALPVAAVLAGLLFLGIGAAARVDVPADPRMYVLSPNLKPESPEELALERRKYASPRLLPDGIPERSLELSMGALGGLLRVGRQLEAPGFDAQHIGLGELVEALYEGADYDVLYRPDFGRLTGRPGTSWLARPVTDDLDADRAARLRRYQLDLSGPITGAEPWIRVAETRAAVRLAFPALNDWTVERNLAVAWTENPLDLVRLRIGFEGWTASMLAVFLQDPGTYPQSRRALPGAVVDMDIDPEEEMFVVFIVHYRPGVMYFFEVGFEEDGVIISDPTRD